MTDHLHLPSAVFFTLVLLGALGCDPYWEISGEVVVPADQHPAADDAPMQVLVTTAQQNAPGEGPHLTGPYRVGVLCEPRDATTVTEFKLSGVGCPVPTKLIAWVAPLELRDDVSCNELRAHTQNTSPYAPRSQSPAPPEDEPTGSATAFEGDLPCRLARESARIEIDDE